MIKSEFIEWIENSTSFSKSSLFDYEELVNYEEYYIDYLSLNEDSVIYMWRVKYEDDSDIEQETYTFEEFVELYISNRLN